MKYLSCSFHTRLEFSAPVFRHDFSFRLTPLETSRQQVISHSLLVEPACRLSRSEDGFGNAAHAGRCAEPHSAMDYGMEAVVRTDGSSFETSRPHPQFRFPTRLTLPGEEIRRLHDACSLPQAEEDRALELMHALYREFSYLPGSTRTTTTAEEALLQRQGVCQDYAHILLALLRLEGIPCAYVTGLMLGEGQTHAWAEAYVSGRWLPLDPTHDRVAGEDYVALSRGRDFTDCSIDRGVFHSKEAVFQTQTILARVEELRS